MAEKKFSIARSIRKSVASVADAVDAVEEKMVEPEGAGNATNMLNLLKALTGSTALVIADAVMRGGVLPSMSFLAVYACTFLITFAMLAECCYQTKQTSYSDLWRVSISEKSAWMVDAAICFHAWASCIAYLVCIRDYSEAIWDGMGPIGKLWMVWAMIMPICCLKNLSALKYCSLAGCLFTWIAFAYGYVDFFKTEGTAENLGDRMGFWSGANGDQFWTNMKTTVCHCAAAFGSIHVNAVKMYSESRNKSPVNFRRVAMIAVIVAFLLKGPYGIVGYATMGDLQSMRPRDYVKDAKDAEGNPIKFKPFEWGTNGNYPKGYTVRGNSIREKYGFTKEQYQIPFIETFMVVAMGVSLAFSFPLMFSAGRDSAIRMFNLPKGNKTRIIATFVIGVLLAIPPSLNAPVSIISKIKGALTSNALCMIFPAIIYLNLGSNREDLANKVQTKAWMRMFCYWVLCLSLFTLVFGTWAFIGEMVKGEPDLEKLRPFDADLIFPNIKKPEL